MPQPTIVPVADAIYCREARAEAKLNLQRKLDILKAKRTSRRLCARQLQFSTVSASNASTAAKPALPAQLKLAVCLSVRPIKKVAPRVKASMITPALTVTEREAADVARVERQNQARVNKRAQADNERRVEGLQTDAEHAAAKQSTQFPPAVTAGRILDIFERLSPSAAPSQFSPFHQCSPLKHQDQVCCVCDQFTPPSNCSFPIAVEFGINSLIRVKLSAAAVLPALPAAVIAHYDRSDILPLLGGLLLSPHPSAFHKAVMGADLPPLWFACVCQGCATALKAKGSKPPVNAIANHNAIGIIPTGLMDATWAELAMVTLVFGRACMVVLKGGGQKALRGHVLSVEMDPGAIASKLPHTAAALTYRVVIAGALTPAQKLATGKTHAVRHRMLIELLNFFRANNPKYKDVKIDEEALEQLRNEPLQGGSLIDMQPHDISHDTGRRETIPWQCTLIDGR